MMASNNSDNKSKEEQVKVKELSIEELKKIGINKVEVLPDENQEDKNSVSFNLVEKIEDTRGKLAKLFVIGFFIIFFIISLVSLFTPAAEGRNSIDNLKESILTVSGVLSGPLGFIIGFYFRKGEE